MVWNVFLTVGKMAFKRILKISNIEDILALRMSIMLEKTLDRLALNLGLKPHLRV